MFEGVQISNNQMKSLHWTKLKKKVDQVKLKMWALIQNEKLPKFERIKLTAVFNSKLDVDNITATIKIFVDQLVKQNILKDDNGNHWNELHIIKDAELNHNTIHFLIEESKE